MRTPRENLRILRHDLRFEPRNSRIHTEVLLSGSWLVTLVQCIIMYCNKTYVTLFNQTRLLLIFAHWILRTYMYAWMYIRIHTYVLHAYIRAFIHITISICRSKYTHTHTHAYINIYIYISTHTDISPR